MRTRDVKVLRAATTECRLFSARRTARFVRSGYTSSEASNPCGPLHPLPPSPETNVFSSSIRFVPLVRDGRKLGPPRPGISQHTSKHRALSTNSFLYISASLPPATPFTSCLYCSHLCSSPSLSLSHCADVSL